MEEELPYDMLKLRGHILMLQIEIERLKDTHTPQ